MGEERIIPGPPHYLHREGEVLNELPNALGLVLWQDLRHLRDWAESPSEVRSRLFNPPTVEVHAKRRDARACAAELITALDTFASLKANPVTATPRDIGRACERVVNWALEYEHTRTAIEWAEIAALVEPTNPKSANVAGRVTRNANEYDRAETWFKRGIGYAREQGNVVEQIWGHLGYGRLCQELGWVNGARKHLSRGSHLAWKKGPPSLAASAQHDLAAMLMMRGYLPEAVERARRALLWYPKNHPRIPHFAVDCGLLLVLGSRFASATRVLRAAMRSIELSSVRTMVLAMTASAYAGMGVPAEAAVWRHRALKMLDKHPQMEAATRWHLANALRLAKDWSAAEVEAAHVLAVAVEQNDREIQRMTRILIGWIGKRRAGRDRLPASAELREFVGELSGRLSAWSPRRGRNYRGPWGENRAA
jgi:tetratricopeptide (TPR) repeat protein